MFIKSSLFKSSSASISKSFFIFLTKASFWIKFSAFLIWIDQVFKFFFNSIGSNNKGAYLISLLSFVLYHFKNPKAKYKTSIEYSSFQVLLIL